MSKKKYVPPIGYGVKMDTEELLKASIVSTDGNANVGLGFGDPGSSGEQSAASRGSFWDDTE